MKTYLGDGAYIEFNGYEYVITTSDGIHNTNVVVLDTNGMQILFHFVELVKAGIDYKKNFEKEQATIHPILKDREENFNTANEVSFDVTNHTTAPITEAPKNKEEDEK